MGFGIMRDANGTTGKGCSGMGLAGGAAALALLLLASVPSPAQTPAPGASSDGSNPVQGGPGGAPFKNACNQNAFITGITVHSGAWIDSIAADCGILTPSKDRFFPGAPRATAAAGGHGGSERHVACSPNQYVTSIKYGFTRDENRPKYLDYVQLDCAPLLPTGNQSTYCLDSGGNGCWDKHPNPGPYNGFGLAFVSRCAPGLFPDALLGRAGDYVDALALRCVRRP